MFLCLAFSMPPAPPTACFTTAKTHQSVLELESPLSSAFQTHLPLPGCWLEYAPHFLEKFAEIKIITFLSQKTATNCPISPPCIGNRSNLCSTLLCTPSHHEVKSQMFAIQTNNSPSGSSCRYCTCDREKLKHPKERTQQGRDKQSNAAGLLPAASLWGPPSDWQ